MSDKRIESARTEEERPILENISEITIPSKLNIDFALAKQKHTELKFKSAYVLMIVIIVLLVVVSFVDYFYLQSLSQTVASPLTDLADTLKTLIFTVSGYMFAKNLE